MYTIMTSAAATALALCRTMDETNANAAISNAITAADTAAGTKQHSQDSPFSRATFVWKSSWNQSLYIVDICIAGLILYQWLEPGMLPATFSRW
jgi:uncharacterized caspase-like protein